MSWLALPFRSGYKPPRQSVTYPWLMVEMTGIEPVGALVQTARPQTIANPENNESRSVRGGFLYAGMRAPRLTASARFAGLRMVRWAGRWGGVSRTGMRVCEAAHSRPASIGYQMCLPSLM